MNEYQVKQGECISSIAADKGHFWQTLWDHPNNAELRRIRSDPNVLMSGDRVHVPEIRIKEVAGQTESRHRFLRKGEPAKLRLRLVREREHAAQPEQGRQESAQSSEGGRFVTDEISEQQPQPMEDEPRANVPYKLKVDGHWIDGTTDDDGRIEVPIPGNARQGKLILNPGTDHEEELELQLGHLNPISEIVGVKERLANLTFESGDRSDEITPGFSSAVRAFQEKHNLEPTGELTDETRQRIEQEHGS